MFLYKKGVLMTTGKPPSSPREHKSKRREEGVVEDGVDMEKTHMMPQDSEGVLGEGIDAKLQAKLGQTLKAMFDEVARAPVPDKFLDLLKQLDSREKGK
jgi:Anti-sigma factor NepR